MILLILSLYITLILLEIYLAFCNLGLLAGFLFVAFVYIVHGFIIYANLNPRVLSFFNIASHR